MSQQYGGLPPLTPPSSTPPSTPAGLSWTDTWIKALTQPSEETYAAIASDAVPGSDSKAYTWVFLASIISQLIAVIASFAFYRTTTLAGPGGAAFEQFRSSSPLISLICSPIFAAISVLLFIVLTGITQLIAGAFGGTGTYSKLLYTTAAFSAPMAILTAVLGLIPFVGCFNLVLGIYSIVLDVIAVKAVNQFSWGKAILSSLVIWILLLIFAAVIVIVILAILGPSIGNIFSNIVREL